MKAKIELPRKQQIKINYSEHVYNPNHTSVDAVVLADKYVKDGMSILDVGCGSGFLGLSIKQLHPKTDVWLMDIDPSALLTAQQNAKMLRLDIHIKKNDLLDMLPYHFFDMIVANLPTFDKEDMEAYEQHGPVHAYLAHETDGLYLYRRLIVQAQNVLRRGGILICEVQDKLQSDFEEYIDAAGFTVIARTDYAYALRRKV